MGSVGATDNKGFIGAFDELPDVALDPPLTRKALKAGLHGTGVAEASYAQLGEPLPVGPGACGPWRSTN